jgi:predicted RNA-binding Zn-ribbon protein involved in translation (DUF1610 family)
MKSLRVWPARYCPECGGRVLRGRFLGAKGAWVGGAGELPGWVGLAVGWLVAAAAGKALGIFVGVAVGVFCFALLFWYALRVERAACEYACEKCGKVLPWSAWSQRSGL